MQTITKEEKIKEDLARVINIHGLELPSNTPDYMLANYLYECLESYNATITKRAIWYDSNCIDEKRYITK